MHEHQHIQGLEQHRLDREEVAGDDALGLGGKELTPCRLGAGVAVALFVPLDLQTGHVTTCPGPPIRASVAGEAFLTV